ncbi:MAG: GNAT family N-acetyltransferase [Chloroflexi bacterium]|nr:GNAT family N-acetyltransferase [Chloroflexota bacterium]
MVQTLRLTLITERLILRPFTMDDCEALLAITQEPDIFRYFPTKAAWDMEKVERNIQHQINHWKMFGYGQMAVTMRETGQLMGWCGLEFLNDTNETEVGYLLGHAFWGKGLATEAARASVQFGLEEIGLREIIGLTDPLNIASQRVLEKCGLSFTWRQVYFGMEMFRFAIQA